jgi:hypothetical protein
MWNLYAKTLNILIYYTNMNKRVFWISGGLVFFILLFFIPVTQHRVVSYGIDSYVTHAPIFSGHVASEQFITQSNIIGIGTILVNFYHAKQLSDVQVTIFNTASHEIIISKVISAQDIHDDQFAYIIFKDKPIPANTNITVQYSAPDATIKNVIGVRFGKTKEDLSIALVERVPVWKALLTIAHNRQNDWIYVAPFAGIALLLSLAVLNPFKKPILYWAAIGIVLLFAYATMLWIIPQFGGASGGDPYNYLSISQSIQHGQNPFINSKRLPGYPILLVPTLASGLFDDQLVMRIITSTAGILGAFFLALIARQLTGSWLVALATAVIVAFQKDYMWTAMRPEPYAVYTLLLLISLFLFFECYKHPKTWKFLLFGFFLGWSAMTRQEGFVLALVLGALSAVYEIFSGKNWRRILAMYLPALVVISPFLITNFIQYQNPFHTNYLNDERLQPVDSFLAFQDAVGATWGVLGSMWKTSWDQLERIPLTSTPLILGVLSMWAWYAYNRFITKKITQNITGAVLIVVSILLILASVYTKHEFSGLFTPISAGFILASIPIFLLETKWRGAVLMLVLFSQIGIATWFHPFAKHYEQSYGIIVLMIAVALLSRVPKKGLLTYGSLTTAILPFLLVGALLGQNLNTAIDKQNTNTALDSVTYRAARFARTLPQPVAFDQAYLPARLYFDPNAKYFPDEDNPTPQMEQDWLAQNPIKTLIVSNGNNVFKKAQPNWKIIKTFKAAGNDEKIFESIVYAVQ